jgi:HSP20 family protein
LAKIDKRSAQGRVEFSQERKNQNMKTLEIWNPFRELNEVQNRLSTFFGGLPEFGRFPRRLFGNGDVALPDWSPLVDISEDDKEYLLKADLPEMKKEDVKVTVENNVLSVSGERKSEKEETKKKFHRIERSFGTFLRTFTLPDDADSTKIAAEFKEGVLKVHLPKTPAVKPRTVDVKVQ